MPHAPARPLADAAAPPAPPHTRFIPREELHAFAAWSPGAFQEAPTSRIDHGQPLDRRLDAPAPPPPQLRPSGAPGGAAGAGGAAPQPGTLLTEADLDHLADEIAAREETLRSALRAELSAELQAAHAQQLADALATQTQAARQQGYQDGYRDGLVALDSFKQSHAQQLSAQLGQLLQALDSELRALEQQIATSVARVATQLARQVVRTELRTQPELVAKVAQEAIDAVLMSARHITVLVHPDDHPLVAQGCEEVLAARGARLLAATSVARGGCRVESDAGTIDARIAARWEHAAQLLGAELPWDGDAAA